MNIFYLLTLLCAPTSNNLKENFIRYEDLPVCSNCKYFMPRYLFPFPGPNNLSKCKKFGRKNVITGTIKHDYADDCREDNNKCGNHGKFFEEKL
jgi:hypothetical protein